jgi:hypothetical protein
MLIAEITSSLKEFSPQGERRNIMLAQLLINILTLQAHLTLFLGSLLSITLPL